MTEDIVEIIYKISDFLRIKGINDIIPIDDIIKNTRYNKNTVEKYLNMIEFIQEKTPKIKTVKNNVKIEKLSLDIGKLDEVKIFLASLYFKEAFSNMSAVSIESWVNENIILELIEKGYILHFFELDIGKVYLTELGLRYVMLII